MCILIDYKNKALINSKTKVKVYPNCFDDLVQYHAYLCYKGQVDYAEHKLKEVFKGEKVISDMVKFARGEII